MNPQGLIEPARERVTHNRKRGTGTVSKHGNRWQAYAPRTGKGTSKGLYIGTFKTREEAAAALDAWLLKEVK